MSKVDEFMRLLEAKAAEMGADLGPVDGNPIDAMMASDALATAIEQGDHGATVLCRAMIICNLENPIFVAKIMRAIQAMAMIEKERENAARN